MRWIYRGTWKDNVGWKQRAKNRHFIYLFHLFFFFFCLNFNFNFFQGRITSQGAARLLAFFFLKSTHAAMTINLNDVFILLLNMCAGLVRILIIIIITFFFFFFPHIRFVYFLNQLSRSWKIMSRSYSCQTHMTTYSWQFFITFHYIQVFLFFLFMWQSEVQARDAHLAAFFLSRRSAENNIQRI